MFKEATNSDRLITFEAF